MDLQALGSGLAANLRFWANKHGSKGTSEVCTNSIMLSDVGAPVKERISVCVYIGCNLYGCRSMLSLFIVQA